MSPRGRVRRLPDVQQLVAAAQGKPKQPAYNSKAVVLDSQEICQRLGIARRTFYKRLKNGWKDGHWFFQVGRHWFIRESHLEELISMLERGKLL